MLKLWCQIRCSLPQFKIILFINPLTTITLLISRTTSISGKNEHNFVLVNLAIITLIYQLWLYSMFLAVHLPFIIFLTSYALEKCFENKPQKLPEFRLVERCHKSKLWIAARANFATLSACKRFAIEKKALSFNFSPGGNKQPLEYTCEALECPKLGDRTTLTKDVGYDYYSIYPYFQTIVNSTCIPTVGVFYLLKQKKNYTQAIAQCHNKSSILADVISEQKTEALAQLLSDVNINSAYINLKKNNSSDFVNTNGDALQCKLYRAWASGHPRNRGKTECVVITRHRTWLSVPCDKEQAAICEVTPEKLSKKRYFMNS